MDRGRLKTFVLLLLLTVNLVFLAMIVAEWAEVARQRSEAKTELVQVLGRMGIEMAYEDIPEEGAQALYFVDRDIAAERQVATALLGAPEERDEGGGIYHYQSPHGQAQFRGGTFWVQFTGYETMADTDLGEWMGLGLAERGRAPGRVTYALTIEGRPIQNGQVAFLYADGYMREISGTALWGARAGYAAGHQQDVATALITLAGHLRAEGAVSRFTRMEMGYYLLEGPGYLELRPIWIVSTDTGIFSVDRQSGEIRG